MMNFIAATALFALVALSTARSTPILSELASLSTGQEPLYKDLSVGYALPPRFQPWPAEAKCFNAIDNSTRHVTGAELKDAIKRAYYGKLTPNDKISKAKDLKSYTGETIASDGNFVVFIHFYSWADQKLYFAVDLSGDDPVVSPKEMPLSAQANIVDCMVKCKIERNNTQNIANIPRDCNTRTRFRARSCGRLTKRD